MKILLVCLGAMLMQLLLANQATGARPLSCCLRIMPYRVTVNELMYYIVQDVPLCPIKAVRFVTNKKSSICSDLSSPWAKRAMEYLDKSKVSVDIK